MRLNLNVFKMADIQKLNVNSTTYDISVPWGKVTGKPDTFTPSSHTHNNYVTTDTAQTITGTKTFNNGDQSPITLVRSSSDFVSVRFDGSSGILGYLGFMGVDQPMYRRVSDNTYLNLLHSGNSSVSKSGETLTVTINGVSKSLTNTNTTYTSLKNPYSLSIFGVSYDGSSAKTLTGASFNEGTSNLTDGTMLLTSYASDSGFADTNAPGTVYKRKASCVWGYIQGKADARYSLLGHTHNYAASSHTHTRSQITDFSHTHTKSQITDFPSSMPASDVYSWAKAASKPTYTYSEVGAAPASHSHSNYVEKYISVNTKDMNTIKDPGIYYGYNMTNSGNTSISNFIVLNYSPDWGTQLQFSPGNDKAFCRFWQNSGGVMQSTWKEFSFVGHTHSYLSLNGGTVNGSITATAFYQSSDERLKTFHDPIKVDLEKLKLLRKNYFKFNDKDKLEIGVSAQEVQEIYPELVSSDDNGYLSVAYDKLSVIALSAIDKLDDDIKELKQENNDLKDQLSTIKNILKEKGIL